MNDFETRIEQGKKAIPLAKERGMDTSLWEKALARLKKWQEKLISTHPTIIKKTEQGVIGFVDRMDKVNAITLVQAKAVARRTRELLATQGSCLWKCSTLDSEVMAVVRDELVKTPEGYPVYTESELEELCRDNVGQATLRLVHEAKN